MKPNGYVLRETSDIVVIATGFRRRSSNPKTGDMIQIWILARRYNPVCAIKLNKDSLVCFDCKHRGNHGKGRKCYVRVANAPLGIWKAWRRDMYPHAPLELIPDLFAGRKVRFGAYGEPVLLPIELVSAIAAASAGWTGYTHQWRRPEFAEYRRYLMASCDSALEREQAHGLGWRTFRVRGQNEVLSELEISCPASAESGHRTTCAQCRLCNGARESDARKDITILAHGSGAKAFNLIQIGVAA